MSKRRMSLTNSDEKRHPEQHPLQGEPKRLDVGVLATDEVKWGSGFSGQDAEFAKICRILKVIGHSRVNQVNSSSRSEKKDVSGDVAPSRSERKEGGPLQSERKDESGCAARLRALAVRSLVSRLHHFEERRQDTFCGASCPDKECEDHNFMLQKKRQDQHLSYPDSKSHNVPVDWPMWIFAQNPDAPSDVCHRMDCPLRCPHLGPLFIQSPYYTGREKHSYCPLCRQPYCSDYCREKDKLNHDLMVCGRRFVELRTLVLSIHMQALGYCSPVEPTRSVISSPALDMVLKNDFLSRQFVMFGKVPLCILHEYHRVGMDRVAIWHIIRKDLTVVRSLLAYLLVELFLFANFPPHILYYRPENASSQERFYGTLTLRRFLADDKPTIPCAGCGQFVRELAKCPMCSLATTCKSCLPDIHQPTICITIHSIIDTNLSTSLQFYPFPILL